MKKPDLNDIARLEKAIAKKYGDETIQTPQSQWDDQKEQNYLEQLKQLAQKDLEFFDNERKVKEDGFLLTLKERQYYTKPSEERREKKNRAKRRNFYNRLRDENNP